MALTINGIKVAGKGKDGAGVIAGGTSGQILTKKSNVDYDTEWTSLEIPDVTEQINTHNTDTSTHSDIRSAIPTKVSDLTNDSGYLTEHQSLDGLATESHVDAAIAEHNTSSNAHSNIRTSIATHVSNTNNPHNVTAEKIGLGKALVIGGVEIGTATLPESLSWQYIVYGGGRFVATVYNSNVAAYSDDGTNWTITTLPSSANWTAITYGNGRFVAVARSSNKAAYSDDGITWIATTLPTSAQWSGVGYGNGRFIAVSGTISSASNIAAYSDDGISWTSMTMPTSASWQTVIYGNNMFIVLSYAHHVVAYSNNGTSWSYGDIPSGNYSSVAYGNNMFVAVPGQLNSSIFYSYDGITWTKITINNNACRSSITYGNGKFVTVNKWDTLSKPTNTALYSTDGINWIKSTLPSEQNWNSVCYGDGKFVAVASGSNMVAVSDDGITWTNKITEPVILDSKGVNITDTVKNLVAPDMTGIATESYVTTATAALKNELLNGAGEAYDTLKELGDLIDENTDALDALETVATGKQDKISGTSGQIVGFDAEGNAVAQDISANNINYDNVTSGLTATNVQAAIDEHTTNTNNPHNVTAEQVGLGGAIVYSETEGSTAQMPSNDMWRCVAYGNGKFIAIDNTTNFKKTAQSVDGVLWESVELTVAPYVSSNWERVVYGDNKFVVFNVDRIAYSIDGIEWTKVDLPVRGTWKAVIYANGRFVAVGNNSKNVVYSMDGINWTNSSMNDTGYWFDIAYGNDKFVAVAINTWYVNYSTDANTWYRASIPAADWTACAYGNNKFVAIARGTNQVAYSTDGISWTQSTLPISSNWISMTYAAGKFVAVATDSNIAVYSEDGIVWYETTLPSINGWYSVTYGNNQFVAIAQNSTSVALSYDGITWFETVPGETILTDSTGTDITEDVKALVTPDLSSKQDKITGIAGQTVEFDSTGNLIAVNKEATSSTIIRIW